MTMNLRVGGRSNDALGKRRYKNGVSESVNMAVIIGKDKRSAFGDQRQKNEEEAQSKFMSNKSEEIEKPAEQFEESEPVSEHRITAEQLNAIGRGKIRRKSGQKKELE